MEKINRQFTVTLTSNVDITTMSKNFKVSILKPAIEDGLKSLMQFFCPQWEFISPDMMRDPESGDTFKIINDETIYHQ